MRKLMSRLHVFWICSLLVCLLASPAVAVTVQLLGTGLPSDPTFGTNPLPPNPEQPGLAFSDADLNAQYNAIFGAPSPNELPRLTWGESQERVIMSLISDGSVDTFQTFNFLATGDYWTVLVNMIFNPATAVIFDPNDELSMTGYLQHFGTLSTDGIPHAGDAAAGPQISYELLINAGNKQGVENPFGGTSFAVADFYTAQALHPNEGHRDILLGAMAANVRPDTNHQISFIDHIDGFWLGGVAGYHVIPEPSAVLLFGTGIAGAFLSRRRMFKKKALFSVVVVLVMPLVCGMAWAEGQREEAIFAGGCFWCMESDFESIPGVTEVISGYIGGKTENPTYRNYSKAGHIEAVRIVFDPAQISYRQLLEEFWPKVDPTDAGGQFCDRGHSYTTAIFYRNEEQKRLADESKAALEASGKLTKPVVTPVIGAGTFYPAEGYHQDYYHKNPAKYKFYRFSCGRDRRLKAVWGKE